MHTESNIDNWDIGVVVTYLLSVLAVGVYATMVYKKETVRGYFLAGRYMGWITIGASLFATNIGSEHFVGLAGSGAASGLSVAAFELNASILLQLLGWVFLPVYIANEVSTLPEYMSKRFGGRRIQVYLAVLSLVLYVFTKISVDLYSGSLFLTEALRWNTWISVILLLGLTAFITLTGGLAAVIYTDTLQCFVMIVGAFVLAGFGFARIGGFGGLLDKYGSAIATFDLNSTRTTNLIVNLANMTTQTDITSLSQLASYPGVDSALMCSLPSPKAFKLLREIDDPDMPWLGFLLGQTPASIWYWCADQMMVQRVLSAKSLAHAQGGTLFTGIIKQLPLFLIVVPGMISRVLYTNEVACIPGEHCVQVCGQRNGCSNLAYPKLVMNLLPSGLRGLLLAVMLAAIVSDLTSIFNSASTLFAVDIYHRIRKKAKQSELVAAGRLFVVLLIGVSIAWIPVVQSLQGSQLYIYIQSVSACLAPPIAAVYLLAVLWRFPNEKGALWALIYGFLVGVTRIILTVIYSEPVCGDPDMRPWIVSKVHYMYFGVFSFVSTALVMTAISALGDSLITNERLDQTTYWSVFRNNSLQTGVSLLPTNKDGHPRNGSEIQEYNLEEIASKDCELRNNQCKSLTDDSGQYVRGPKQEESIINHSSPTESPPPSRCCRRMRHPVSWRMGYDESRRRSSRQICSAIRSIFRSHSTSCRWRSDGSYWVTQMTESAGEHLVSIHRTRGEKIVLTVGFFGIMCIAIFGFTFFSLYFQLIVPGPITLRNLINSTLPDNVHLAVEKLRSLGLATLEG